MTRPRVLLDPENVIVLQKPPRVIGSITVDKHVMRVRTCGDCGVATTMPMCPCCGRSTVSDQGVGEMVGERQATKRCPSCGRHVRVSAQRCPGCDHDFRAPLDVQARDLPERGRLALPASDDVPEDAIDVPFRERR